MKNIVTISGWGQLPDSLEPIAPGAQHLSYRDAKSPDAFIQQIKKKKIACDVLIGWSQGAQLALKAVTEKALKTKLLVLLAPPFQFVCQGDVHCGMQKDVYDSFVLNFEQDAERMLKRFSLLVAWNDTKSKEIAAALKPDTGRAARWGYWLNQLETFTCADMLFEKLPATLIIHGQDDTLVDVSNTSVFLPFILQAQVKIIEHCGHAPHLHDSALVQEMIRNAYERL